MFFPDLVTGSGSANPVSTARGLSATQREAGTDRSPHRSRTATQGTQWPNNLQLLHALQRMPQYTTPCQSASTIVMLCCSASTILRSKSCLGKPVFQTLSHPNSSGVRGSWNPPFIPRTWSGKLPASFHPVTPDGPDSCGPTSAMSLHVPKLVVYWHNCPSLSMTTDWATINLPSHMGRLFPSSTPCILWVVSKKCLGTITPLARGFSTVSDTVPLKLRAITANWWHVQIVLFITRACALMSKTHWSPDIGDIHLVCSHCFPASTESQI